MARSRRSRSTLARAEVRRLSGGNQQKVTIARWVAGGVRDDALLRPDARHRHPARSTRSTCCSATSRTPGRRSCSTRRSSRRSSSSCDRAIVIFGGRVVAEIGAADADETDPAARRVRPPGGCRDARGDRGGGRSRPMRSTDRPECRRRASEADRARLHRRTAMSARPIPWRAPSGPVDALPLGRQNALDPRAPGRSSSSCSSFTKSHPADLRRDRRSRASRSPSCRSRWRPSRRRSS